MNTAHLWHNESDPNIEAISRYADDQHKDCDGLGIVRVCDEWQLCDCTKAALLAAAPEVSPLRLVQNDAAAVRWSNDDYANRSKVAGGVLVIKKEAA